MRIILTASKDTSIYQAYPNNNAGLDEILEIGKLTNADTFNAKYDTASVRALIHFELPTTESVPNNAKYYVNLRLANATEIKRTQKILVYKVSSSWVEGSGYFYQNIKNVKDGATWRQLDGYTSWSMYGGDFLTASISSSISLDSYPIQDLKIDVTDILQPLVSQSLQNTFYGLGLQFPTVDEDDKYNEGNLKVFSTQTHTVHQPSLEIAWDSQTFITGTILRPIPQEINVKLLPKNLQSSYMRGDISRINLVVRDEYPLRSFDSTLRYKNKYYLPSSSYYSIVDVQSNVTIIPFDTYSKINCDTSGSYIILDTSPLYRGRYYSIKFKVSTGTYTKTIDPELQFSIL